MPRTKVLAKGFAYIVKILSYIKKINFRRTRSLVNEHIVALKPMLN